MPYTLVRIRFEEYEKWKTVFTEASPLRKSYGSKGVRVFRNANEPDEVLILGEYEDLEKARQLFQSPEFRAATQRAGVFGAPDVKYLDETAHLPA